MLLHLVADDDSVDLDMPLPACDLLHRKDPKRDLQQDILHKRFEFLPIMP